jgi:hypothetical protein
LLVFWSFKLEGQELYLNHYVQSTWLQNTYGIERCQLIVLNLTTGRLRAFYSNFFPDPKKLSILTLSRRKKKRVAQNSFDLLRI